MGKRDIDPPARWFAAGLEQSVPSQRGTRSIPNPDDRDCDGYDETDSALPLNCERISVPSGVVTPGRRYVEIRDLRERIAISFAGTAGILLLVGIAAEAGARRQPPPSGRGADEQDA